MVSTKDLVMRVIERLTSTDQIGRRFPAFNHQRPILVFAAHPDDDVIGIGITMRKHVQNGSPVHVVFTTNGSNCRHRRQMAQVANTRYEEACLALSKIGIGRDSVSCLGFPDGRLHRYMKQLALDVSRLMREAQPRKVYVHSIEGGHRDHDVTSFVVQKVCKNIGYNDVFEWAEYNTFHPLGSTNINFPPDPMGTAYNTVETSITNDEFELKKNMLMAHASQVGPIGFQQYQLSAEVIRRCNLDNLELKLKHFWNFGPIDLGTKRLEPAIKELNRFLYV